MLTEKDKQFMMGVQLLAQRYGVTVDIDMEKRTMNFDGPPEKEYELAIAIQKFVEDMEMDTE